LYFFGQFKSIYLTPQENLVFSLLIILLVADERIKKPIKIGGIEKDGVHFEEPKNGINNDKCQP
jgi:hypothetical protein